MGFITDYQIEMSAGKQFSLLILYRINAIHHGLISRENTMSLIIILFLAQICHR